MATASSSALAALQAAGTSVWLDDISRQMLQAGELARLIREDGLRGMTSNPSIFQKAIGTGAEYDDDVKLLVGSGSGLDSIYQALTVADIRAALDAFKGIYQETDGLDGYVSLEVSPYLAKNTEGTVAEAKKLWGLLDRPNAMIKVPGTPEGLPAIEELLFCGINVNVTLLFSVDAYRAVAETYIKALKRRAEAGQPVDRLASVASFFISRIDTEADKRLEAQLKQVSNDKQREMIQGLMGQVAILNGKNAYAVFEELFHGPEFADLKAKGAHVQRVLWASVGTKNPKYPDTLYTAGLVGPETVSTMPRAAFDAFKDHGEARSNLAEGMAEAKALKDDLGNVGVDLDSITDKLLADGIKVFEDSFDQLYGAIREKQAKILQTTRVGQTATYAEADLAQVEDALSKFEREDAVRRMWAKDATLWKSEPDAAKIIGNALGWLRVPQFVLDHADEVKAFAEEVRDGGFTHVLVMGMGGSSLCVEVLNQTQPLVAGWPELLVLDSTVPAFVHRIEEKLDVANTLFVVSSKSGTTTEPSVFYAYFFDKVKKIKGSRAGENFVAITDPGTKMEADAKRDGFRHIFLNPSDIGGRYSALSYFGMVPAALRGLDLKALLGHAQTVAQQCQPESPLKANPGATLGAAMGAFAASGRDKVTLVTPEPLPALGLWIEQLIAESTGKEGRGILPVAGEPVGPPEVYGPDRFFVLVRTAEGTPLTERADLMALSAAGHPVLDLVMAEPIDIGAEFFRWEIATPLAGKVIGINPFDQPNVQESKDNTKHLIEEYQRDGKLTDLPLVAEFEGVSLHADEWNKAELLRGLEGKSERDLFAAVVKAHLARIKPGDYFAITQYVDERPSRDEAIGKLRRHIRDHFRVATTTGYGPRFLHSTGQLHKGGSDAGVFLQITADDGADIAVPDFPCGFATLAKAQSLGDFQSLAQRHRRALNVHLKGSVEKGLETLHSVVHEVIGHHPAGK